MGRERAEQQPGYIPTEGLTLEEDRRLVELLNKWNGGRISTPAFTEIARMSPQPIVEVVIFRMIEGRLETLLIPRPEDDVVWPGMYHTPGAALRAADFQRADQTPVNGAFERIQRGELSGEFADAPTFVGWLDRLGDRGPESARVFIAELPEGYDHPDHIWYSVDQLAQNPKFIQHQLPHVLMAAEQYVQMRS